MKKKIILIVLFALMMVSVPLIAAKDSGAFQNGEDYFLPSSDSSSEASESLPQLSQRRVFRILDKSTDTVVAVPDKDFCIGALAYEMAPSFHQEALKAQTVALYTHFCRLRSMAQEKQQDYDFAADLSAGELYLDEQRLRKKWGTQYEPGLQQLQNAVGQVFGQVLTDEQGKLIDAAYHAMSSGITEDAKDIFGKEDPHLKPKASPGDKKAKNYITKVTVTGELLTTKLKALNAGFSPKQPLQQLVGKAETTSSGTVKTIAIGGCSFTGAELRKQFDLRSAVFTLQYENGQFCFTVRGYGHGVGLSQWGAQAMAQQGSTYQEILFHYYSDCQLRYAPQ